MWIALGAFLVAWIVVVAYVELDKKKNRDKKEPVPPFIEHFTVNPDFICFSSTESCGAQVSYAIAGDFSAANNDCRLILKKGDHSRELQSGAVSYNRTIPAADFIVGAGKYQFTLILDDKQETRTVTLFQTKGEIIRDVSVVIDKGDQTSISDVFTIGPPNSGADYETCSKIVYMTAIQYSDKGTENEMVFISVENSASGNVRLGEYLTMPGEGVQIANSKIEVRSTQTADSLSYNEGDIRKWQLTLYMHC